MKFIKSLIIAYLFLSNISYSQISVLGKIDHIKPDGIDTIGNITLNVSGSTSPYTYTWNPGAINTKDISNITAGQYTVNVVSASSQTYTNAYKLGYKVLWTNLINAVYRGDTLFGTDNYCGASSKNTLAANTDGWFEYVIASLPATHHYIGFSDSISPLTTFADIDYGIYFEGVGLDLYAVHTGSANVMIKNNAKIGDVVRVERTGNVIKYLINNVAVRTITVSGVSSKTYKLRSYFLNATKLNYVGCSFSNIGNQDFSNYVKLKPYFNHCSGLGISDGFIKVMPNIPFTNTYSWSPGGAATNTVSSLDFGDYKVEVSDSILNKSTHYYHVGYKTKWTNLNKCIFRNDSLISNASAGVSSTTISKNTLKANQNGWVEFVAPSLSSYSYYVGFLDSISPNAGNFQDLDFAFYFNATTDFLQYYESGTTNVLYYVIQAGDVLRVERIGHSIYYKVNGVTLRTVTVSGLGAKNLKLKSAIQNNSNLSNIGCSFYDNDSISFKNYVNVKPLIKHCSGLGINDGSIKLTPKMPFSNTYSWTPGGVVTNSLTGLAFGNHSVTVTDSLENQTPHSFPVGYKVKWTNLDRCLFRNDSLISIASSIQNSTANSENVLRANENGWVEMVIDKLGSLDYYLGFSDSLSPHSGVLGLKDIDYGIGYVYPYLYRYESGTSTMLNSVPVIGDRIRIWRIGNTIYYQINSVTITAQTVAGFGGKTLKLKSSIEYNNNINNIGCSFYNTDSASFDNYVRVIPLTKHSSGEGINDGSITLKPAVPGSLSYTWQPSASITGTASGLPAGNNTVTVSDTSMNVSSYNYNVGYKAMWTNTVSALFRNDTLKGTGSTSTFGYACTKNILSANTNGWFEFVVGSLGGNNYYVGFTDSISNNSAVMNDILYGFYYSGTTRAFNTYESGTAVTWNLTPKAGDVMRIERVGNSIYYKINGITIRATTNASIGPKILKLKAKLQYTQYISNIGCSFKECNLNMNAGTSQTITCANPNAVLSGTSTVSGVTYSWTPAGTTPTSYSTSVSAAGTYTLKVTNAAGCSAAATVAVIAQTVVPVVNIESSTPTPTLGLNAYWPFTGNANDVSGNANHGTVSNANLTTDRFGNPNRAYEFDGSTSRIDVPNSSTVDMPDGQDFSISFWLKSKSGNSDGLPIAKNQYGSWSGYMFFANNTNGGYCNTDGNNTFYVAAGGGGDACADNPITNDTTNWYFITGQYNGSTNQAFIYVNGVLQSDVGSKSGTSSNTRPLTFGAYNDGAGFHYKGFIDDIRIYSRLLTQNEINALFKEPNPLASPVVLSSSNPVVALKAVPSLPEYTYTWTPGGSTPNNSSTEVSTGGTYSVSVTNTITGCVSTTTLLVVDRLFATALISDYESKDSTGTVSLDIIGGTPPYNVAWNGLKLPSSVVAYHQFIESHPSLPVDSVQYKNFIDSLKQRTFFDGLKPGEYTVTIYDNANDSIVLGINIGVEIQWWAKISGATKTTASTATVTLNNVNYFYGDGISLVQQGSYVPGNHYAVPLSHIDLLSSNEISFNMPTNTDKAYVGIHEEKLVLNGDTNDLEQKATFKFNGNGTFDIVFLGQSIYNNVFASGDKFGLKTNTIPGKITFYKNELQIAEENLNSLDTVNYGYIPKIVFRSANASVTGLRIGNPPQEPVGPLNPIEFEPIPEPTPKIVCRIIDASCENSCNAEIQISALPEFQFLPGVFSINGLSAPVNTPGTNIFVFNNLCALQNYNVIYTYQQFDFDLQTYVAKNISVTIKPLYRPEWVNVTSNVSVSSVDNSLTRTGISNNSWGGASSFNVLNASSNLTEWVEWVSTSGIIGLGFSGSETDASVYTIKWGILIIAEPGQFPYYEILKNGATIGQWGSFTVGDKFKIEKNLNTISFYKNSTLIGFDVISPNADLVLDASLYDPPCTLHPSVSFGCKYQSQCVTLNEKLDGGYYTSIMGKLNFRYIEQYAPVQLHYNVYDKNNSIVASNISGSNIVKPTITASGDNRFTLDFSSSSYLPGYYILEVINSKNEKQYLRFKK